VANITHDPDDLERAIGTVVEQQGSTDDGCRSSELLGQLSIQDDGFV
jgi:hypothetical protein